MNKNFPNWVTSDIILEKIVDGHFGIYITEHDYLYDTVNVTLIPMEMISLIPEEVREAFKKIHDEMMADLNSKIKIVELFNTEFKSMQNITNNRYHLKHKIETDMVAYENVNNVSMKDEFKRRLGIEGYESPASSIKIGLRLV